MEIVLHDDLCHTPGMKDVSRSFNSNRAIFFLMAFIASIVAGGVLKVTAPVILPFTIALLLAFAVYPLVKLSKKFHFPRLLAILLIALLIIAGLYGLGMVFYTSGKMLISLYPKYENRLIDIYKWSARFLGGSYDEDLSFFENLWAQLGIRTFVRTFTFSFSSLFLQFLKSALLMVIFLVFLLVEASLIKEKLEAAFESRSDRINQIGQDLMNQTSRYLTAKFLISLITGLIIAFGLKLAGLEFALVWGVLQFILNFIPVLGSVIVGFGTSLFALIQFWPNPVPVIIVIAIVLGVNIIIGN
ncbi:MAG: AI-2E family transporter, partial [Treponema sp.]|nr:AI-2E family transporter [Treponema sp.]